jgi:DNA-binding response OmpR family regulator
MTTVLLVDDDPAIVENLSVVLQRSGYVVRVAMDGLAALAAVRQVDPDICVLDVVMPELDGREVLRRLRKSGWWRPVVLLTRVGGSGERAVALEEGADDYLNKPFEAQELIARMRAVLRRARAGQAPLTAAAELHSGELRVDRVARRVWLGGRELALTPKALTLLDYLLTRPDEVLTRERLLEVLWGFPGSVPTRAVDNRIAELRRILGPQWIETVQGAGYRFVGSVEAGLGSVGS